MTLKELCRQFTLNANIEIYDITSGNIVTDFVKANKKLCEGIQVKDVEIRGDVIWVSCIMDELTTYIKAYTSAQILRSYCKAKPTIDDCSKCMFFNSNCGKENRSLKPCLIAGKPQYWNF